MARLTDEQCNEFRRMKGSFNDMVNGIFEAGRMTGAQEAFDCVSGTIDESKAMIQNHFGFKA